MTSTVDLGFFEQDYEPWEVECRYFPSKVGGRPAWLDLKDLPSVSEMECPQCQQPRKFLLQVYAPDNKVSEAFHRTIFLFICTTNACWTEADRSPVLVLRSQLGRDNDYYPSSAPEEGGLWRPDLVAGVFTSVCAVCGARGESRCGQCRAVSYCGQAHQKLDWRSGGHKARCGQSSQPAQPSPVSWCLREGLLDMEEEPDTVEDTRDMDKYEEMAAMAGSGSLADCEGLEDVEREQVEDRLCERFRARVSRAPAQVVRYERGGQPLLCTASPALQPPPGCQQCGGERTLEFQVMPQLLTELGLGLDTCQGLDWGSLYVYTCEASCPIAGGYYREHVQIRNFDNTNLPLTERG